MVDLGLLIGWLTRLTYKAVGNEDDGDSLVTSFRMVLLLILYLAVGSEEG